MSEPVATLAGVPIRAFEDAGWRQPQGVRPYQRHFEFKTKDAEAIFTAFKTGGDVTLSYSRNGLRKTSKGLKLLSMGPGSRRGTSTVLVSDLRCFWDRIPVVGDFNTRQRSGEFRIVDGVLQHIPPVADITFRKCSLENELTPWQAKGVLAYVLDKVTLGKYSLEGGDFSRSVDIDSLILRDPGPSAIERVCAYIPGLAVWLDDDSVCQVTMVSGGDEEGEVARSPSPIVGPSLSARVDLSAVRPVGIDVYFQPEDETRFDLLDNIPTPTTVAVSQNEPRTLVNVMRLPDTITYVSGPLVGKKIVANTWVPIDQYLFDAWNDLTVASNAAVNSRLATVGSHQSALPIMSFDVLWRLWFAPGLYHAYFEIPGGSGTWGRRWRALYQYYSSHFQITSKWTSRCHSFRATRLAIVDPESGTQAPADVYADHAVVPTAKRIAFQLGDPSQALVKNEFAWPFGDPQRLLAEGHVCESALVTVEDQDCFVFKVDFAPRGSQIDQVESVVPRAIMSLDTGETGAISTTDPTGQPNPGIPISDPRAPKGNFTLYGSKLSAYHRFTTVLTLGTASPQGLAGMYKISVTPTAAKGVLPGSVSRNIGDCNGPRLGVFVGPDVCTARFAWLDQNAALVEMAILKGLPTRLLSSLLDPVHMTAVANAVAASYYSSLADRREGAHVSRFNPGARPVGRIQSVIHKLDPQGRFVTELDMATESTPIDFMALMPESTRRQIFRKVQR